MNTNTVIQYFSLFFLLIILMTTLKPDCITMEERRFPPSLCHMPYWLLSTPFTFTLVELTTSGMVETSIAMVQEYCDMATNVRCWIYHQPKRCVGIRRITDGWMDEWMDESMEACDITVVVFTPLCHCLLFSLYCTVTRFVPSMLKYYCIFRLNDCILSVKDLYKQRACCLTVCRGCLYPR